MKVAIDTRFLDYPDYAQRGVGRYAEELVRAMARLVDPETIVLWGFPVSECDLEFSRQRILFGQTRIKTIRRNIIHPAKLLWNRIGLIHYLSHHHRPAVLRTKSVVTVHDLMQEKPTRSRRTSPWFDVPPLIITVSKNEKKNLIQQWGLTDDRIHVVHHGLSDSIHPAGETDRILLEKLKINGSYYLYVGGFDRRKNIPLLIRMFDEVTKVTKKNEKLVLAGPVAGKEQLEPVHRLLIDRKLESKVVFTGFVSDRELSALYSFADMFVFPSSYEGFGFPPLEAMKCGTVPLAFKNSTMPELIRFDEFLVDDGDISAFVKAWIYLSQHSEQVSTRFKKRLMERADTFSWQKAARKTLELYKKALLPGRLPRKLSRDGTNRIAPG